MTLFANLGATDEQLDFPVVYASALNGYAKMKEEDETTDMTALFKTILSHVEPPEGDTSGSLTVSNFCS